jgi:hypothetical protein
VEDSSSAFGLLLSLAYDFDGNYQNGVRTAIWKTDTPLDGVAARDYHKPRPLTGDTIHVMEEMLGYF